MTHVFNQLVIQWSIQISNLLSNDPLKKKYMLLVINQSIKVSNMPFNDPFKYPADHSMIHSNI